MSSLTGSTVINFISENFIKGLFGVVVYFLSQMAADISSMKDNLQEVLMKQNLTEQKIITLETKVAENTKRLDKKDEEARLFYQTYDLKRK